MFTRGPQIGLRLFFFTVLSIVLMVLDQREHYLAPLRNALTAVVAPIQYIVDMPIKGLQNLSDNLSTRQKLLAENTALKAKQLLLQAQLQKLIALENENQQLRALLQSTPRMQNTHIAIAHLLAVSTDPLISELVLDKGRNDGVYSGQPVLDANGVMGQIIQVGSLTSRLLLISDLRSAVPVEDARNGVRGIVVGQGHLAKMLLTDIPDTVDVKEGDLLVTSGLGGHFPAGYPVGVVTQVQHDTGAQFTHIEVTPSAQLNRNQPLLIIWPPEQPKIDAPKSITATKAGAKHKSEKGKS
jgi:rod shape-determining protein MreC